jgi:GT2 family glycosyltransferase
VVVVDDGSTDDTSKAIQEEYPQVHLLQGEGNLWWAGAIAKGMEYAINQGADYLIWLNDDCQIFPDAISKLLEICEQNPHTIVGAKSLTSKNDPQPTYGGIIRQGLRIKYIYAGECDGLAGNLVCFPKLVVDAIGYPDYQKFPQYFCDVVYTNQAKRNGFKLLIAEDVNTFCEDDNKSQNWFEKSYSLQEIMAQRFSKKSSSYWSARIRYEFRFLGIYGVIKYIFWECLFKLSFFIVMAFLNKFISVAKLKQSFNYIFSSLNKY